MNPRTCVIVLLAGVVGTGCPLRKYPVLPGDGGLDGPNTGGNAVGGNGTTSAGGSGGRGGESGAGGSGEIGGAAGNTVGGTDCAAGSTRLCKDDPDLRALGNCGDGQEACVAGHWGPCGVLPAAKDGCTLVGDDASCNGLPNEGCPCVDGATQPCGPPADVGICKRGTQACAGGAWGTCDGAVYAAARDCTSAADNDCDGRPDSALDAVCVCAGATVRPCAEHVGQDGTGRCKAGAQSCVVATDKKTSAWGACTGSVAPAAADTCDPGNDDNCNGVPNEGCTCVTGATQACGPSANVGICKRGTQTCTAAAWGPCVGTVPATARDCTSPADNNCDGLPDNTVDAVCGCAAGASQACNQHPGKDGNGPCKAGSQNCVVAADKKSSAWGTCTGAVGPAAADTCDATNDDNCNGIPHDACTCVNGTMRACGPSMTGICKPGTQTCTNATWSPTCAGAVTAQPRDCTSTIDNDCNGTKDNLDSSCVCPANTSGPCPGNNTGSCKSGTRMCILAANKGSTSWSTTCTGAVPPAAADTCDTNNDANCNGKPNEGCQCINGSPPVSCGACATQSCSNGKFSACVGMCSGTTPMCLAPSTCVQCLMDTDCPATSPVCDTSSHTCGCRKGKPGNLLPNAGFDTSSASWGGGTSWSGTSDADGCSASGSLTQGDITTANQSICVRGLTANVLYHVGGWFRGEAANCNVYGYIDSTCSKPTAATMLGTPLAQIGTSTSGWVFSSTTFTPPTTFVTLNCGAPVGSNMDQLFLSTTLTSF